jgi:hypothetical protein
LIFPFVSRTQVWYNAPFEGGFAVHNVKEDEELHVVTPDEPGILGRVMGTLANANVNMRAVCVYTEEGEGHFLLITANNAKAGKALKSLGFKVTSSKVITVEISDRIGAGAEIGALLGNALVDVRYCYGTTSTSQGKALLVFQTSDNKKAYETLK